ncbi:MAG: single-stranded DNA-binding protein [Verrucomicrobia bacterium]|jgi:single-strand DNA-binding protein|nr:single-stranded DNA-binding protein [Verrucomicrobiota bacterium]
MNQTVITGNLTADIETRDLKLNNGDQHLSKFTIASNEGERVVFMPVEAWNMPHLAEYLFKGSKALVSGSLKQENWETEAGDKRSRIVLTAFRVEFLDPAPEGAARGESGGSTRQAGRSRGNAKSSPTTSRENRRAPARGHRAA